MNFNLNVFISKREYIFIFLVLLIFISFLLSYAVGNIALFSLIAFFFLDKKENIIQKLRKIKKNKLVLVFILFFLIQIVGYFYSTNKSIAMRQIEIMFPILFSPAILSVEKMSSNNFKKLITFLKYAILLILSYYLLRHIFVVKRDINTFVNFGINERLGISQVFVGFILLIPLLEGLYQLEYKKNLIINSAIIGISTFFIFLLGNKTIIIFLVILTFLIIGRLQKSNPKLVVFLISFFILFIFIAYHTPVIKNKVNIVLKTTDLDINTIITKNRFAYTKNTFEHRILINHLALKEINKALPFGVGTGDFQEKLDKQYKNVNFKYGMDEKLNNHNQYLAEFLKTGVLGGFVFVFLIFLLLKNSHSDMRFSFLMVLLFTLGCITETFLSRQHGVVIFTFIIPFFLNHKAKL